ncbi:alpha-ketoglutarate-dependent taurine dioxygenase [Microbacteriaceae bacterium SG_E_30_P1]|uniref:Alpha-ketoglutarate-dependent taurine dioxygenase n=1 Tax=Antiquaquibacter oligotrophicus TaxID=2880260 RepID=A0ABT6KNN5_9MICO|nr:TauD/TfdA family dioxygenase [Antiquaquibacter oligotrophicus]MDH6180752.1 alpha-ketoglutarate-dependent taurine dioxygenase [Antiquaquibacter oligotrophicus]UDF13525.1 TauD/TfdA family dioxygenase [Antiquaquibacter oligotrophicus]
MDTVIELATLEERFSGEYASFTEASWQIQLRSVLLREGLVFARGATASDLIEGLEGLGTVFLHPDASASGITEIKPNGDERGGFSRAGLKLHTDRALIQIPPAFLGLILDEAADSGGEALFLDSAELVARLIEVGVSSEDLLSVRLVSGVHGAEALPFLRRIDNVGWQCRYRDDHVGHPSGPPSVLAQIDQAFGELVKAVELVPGESYVLNNHRWLHGRRDFQGARRASRLLFNAVSESFSAFQLRDLS